MVLNHKPSKRRTMKAFAFIVSSFLLMSCASKNTDIIINDDVTEYVRVYIDNNYSGSYRNVIEYNLNSEKTETLIDTSRSINKIFFNKDNDTLYALSDVGLFEVNYKKGTYKTISSEAVNYIYIDSDDEIYYHENIGVDSDNIYKTKLCKVTSAECTEFGFYVSSFSKFEDKWYIVERDNNFEDETFTQHIYNLDFDLLESEVLDKRLIEEDSPTILSAQNLFYIYDSGNIKLEDGSKFYTTTDKIFTPTTQLDYNFNYLVIPRMDRGAYDVKEFDIINLDKGDVNTVKGDGYTTFINNGVAFSDSSYKEDSLTFFFFDLLTNEVYELGSTSNPDIYDLGIFPLKFKKEAD